MNTNKPFSVTYGTGSVSGDIITDNIAIAGLQLNQHTFGIASTESIDFSDNSTPFDGLMGLAQSVSLTFVPHVVLTELDFSYEQPRRCLIKEWLRQLKLSLVRA